MLLRCASLELCYRFYISFDQLAIRLSSSPCAVCDEVMVPQWTVDSKGAMRVLLDQTPLTLKRMPSLSEKGLPQNDSWDKMGFFEKKMHRSLAKLVRSYLLLRLVLPHYRSEILILSRRNMLHLTCCEDSSVMSSMSLKF